MYGLEDIRLLNQIIIIIGLGIYAIAFFDKFRNLLYEIEHKLSKNKIIKSIFSIMFIMFAMVFWGVGMSLQCF